MTDPLVQLMQLLPDACIQITYTPFIEVSKVEIRVPEYSYYVSAMIRSDSNPISIKTHLLYEVCMKEYKRQISLLSNEAYIYVEFDQGYGRVYSEYHKTLYGYCVTNVTDKNKESCKLLNACLTSLKDNKRRSFLSLNYIEELNKLDLGYEICNLTIKKELVLTFGYDYKKSIKYSKESEIPQKRQELCSQYLRERLLLKLELQQNLKFESKVHENLDVSCHIYYVMASQKTLLFTRTYSTYSQEDAEIVALQEFFQGRKSDSLKPQSAKSAAEDSQELPTKVEEETQELPTKVEETKQEKVEEKRKLKIRYESNTVTINKDYFIGSSFDRCITYGGEMYWIDEFTGRLLCVYLEGEKYVDDATGKIIKCEAGKHRAYLISKEKAAIEDQIAELQKKLTETE